MAKCKTTQNDKTIKKVTKRKKVEFEKLNKRAQKDLFRNRMPTRSLFENWPRL